MAGRHQLVVPDHVQRPRKLATARGQSSFRLPCECRVRVIRLVLALQVVVMLGTYPQLYLQCGNMHCYWPQSAALNIYTVVHGSLTAKPRSLSHSTPRRGYHYVPHSTGTVPYVPSLSRSPATISTLSLSPSVCLSLLPHDWQGQLQSAGATDRTTRHGGSWPLAAGQ